MSVSDNIKTVHSIFGIIVAIGALKAWLPKGRIKGDVNNDGKVDQLDIDLVARAGIGVITLTGDDFTAADMNDDGFLNSADLLLIKRLV